MTNGSSTSGTLFSSQELQKHPGAIVVNMGKSGTILTERYDIYGKRIVQNHISQYTILHQSDLFPQFDMKVKIVYLYMYPNIY